MNRRQLSNLYVKLEKVYEMMDRANAKPRGYDPYFYDRIVEAEREARQVEKQVEDAEEELGEMKCYRCNSWFPTEQNDGCLCPNCI